MSNVFRVRDLAQEFEVTNKELIARCGDLDIVAKSAMSRLSEGDVATIRASFNEESAKSKPAKSKKSSEAAPKRAAGKRRSRSRGKSEDTSSTEASVEATPEVKDEADEKPRRRGARRRTSKPTEAAEVKVESDEKPARRARSRRSSKKDEPEVKEAVEAKSEDAAEEKPKRSRRGRSRKPKTEEIEAAEDKSASVESDDAVEAKPKRARRRSKAAEVDAEDVASTEEKPKRSRRGRSRKPKTEEVEAAEEQDTEVEAIEEAAPVRGGSMSDFARAFLRNLGKPQRDPVNEAPATPVSFELPPEPGRVVPSSLAKRGRLWLDELFKAMNIDATATSEYDKDSKALMFNVEGPGSQKLLGSTGTSPKSVESIEKILVQFLDTEELAYTVSLDVNGFRRKAIERLEKLANELAKVAGDVHTSIAVAGLNDFERRVVHRHLAELGEVRTESFDHGSFRKIRIEKD